MFWKAGVPRCGVNEIQTGFGDEIAFSPLDLSQFKVARIVLATCDVNQTHAFIDVPVAVPELTYEAAGFLYRFARNEALAPALLSSIYLRDEGDGPPASIKYQREWAESRTDYDEAWAINNSFDALEAQAAEAVRVREAIQAELKAQIPTKKSLTSQILAAVGLTAK